MDTLIVIDGNSLVNRAYYALPPMLKDGKPTQAIYGFATMLIRMIQTYQPRYIVSAFDLAAPTFRHLRYDGYKATRKHMPDDLAAQMAPLKEMLRRMGVRILEKEGFEADDVIGTMAKKHAVNTYIVTGDRDSLQLIDDTTRVLLTKRGLTEVLELDEAGLMREFSLTPAQIIDYKAIAGDSSDCIPGVSGIGDKGAMELLKQFDSLDNIYAHLDETAPRLKTKLLAGKEQAYLSRELATIDVNVDLDTDLSQCEYKFPFDFTVKEFFIEYGFKSLLKREELFDNEATARRSDKEQVCSLVAVDTEEKLRRLLSDGSTGSREMAIDISESVNFAFDAETEYRVGLSYNLIDGLMDYGRCLEILRPVLEDGSVTKAVYDAKRLMKRLAEFNIRLVNYWDVKLAQYVADVGLDNETADKLLEKNDLNVEYRAAGLLILKRRLAAEMEKDGLEHVYYGLELPLVEVLYSMERQGFKIDLNKLKALSVQFTADVERLTKEIYALCDRTFNINSPKQLAKVLFEDLQLPYPKKGAYSTGADVLQLIAGLHPVVDKILQYRTVSKLNSTYIEGLRKLTGKNGIVHTEFRQTSTATGRLSSVEPNLQNIPVREEGGKQLRGLFIAEEGYSLVSADYSQIELRLLAHFSADKTMIAAYNNGEDIHASTASQVFGVPLRDVTSKMRREAKAVNFGIVYGISDFGLAQNIGITRAQAKEYIEAYFRHFPSVKGYLDTSIAFAKEHGYAQTVMGRRRRIPELFSAQYTTRQFGERVAMNMPLQGSAADVIKAAMIAVAKRLCGMKSRLILQIHDELIVEAADDEVEQVKVILKDCMENAVSLSVPMTVDVGVGKSWIDC